VTLVVSLGSREILAFPNQVNSSSGVGQIIGDAGAAGIVCAVFVVWPVAILAERGVCSCLFVASLAERDFSCSLLVANPAERRFDAPCFSLLR